MLEKNVKKTQADFNNIGLCFFVFFDIINMNEYKDFRWEYEFGKNIL